MSSFRIRPRFKHQVAGQAQEVQNLIARTLEGNSELTTSIMPGHLYVKVHPEKQHFWSPQLHISFEQEDNNVIVRGLYGPKPTLWAIFFFSYIALGILSTFIGMWGVSRWSLGMSSGMLWALPIFALIALMLYFFAQTGQKLGAQQMFDMHHVFEEIVREHIEVE